MAARSRLQARARRAALALPVPPGFHRHHWSYRSPHWCDVFAIPTNLHARLHSFLEYDPAAMCFRSLTGELLDTREKHAAYMARVLRLPRS